MIKKQLLNPYFLIIGMFLMSLILALFSKLLHHQPKETTEVITDETLEKLYCDQKAAGVDGEVIYNVLESKIRERLKLPVIKLPGDIGSSGDQQLDQFRKSDEEIKENFQDINLSLEAAKIRDKAEAKKCQL